MLSKEIAWFCCTEALRLSALWSFWALRCEDWQTWDCFRVQLWLLAVRRSSLCSISEVGYAAAASFYFISIMEKKAEGLMNAHQSRRGKVSVETEFVIKMHGKYHARTDGPNLSSVPMEMLSLCALAYANEATGSVTPAFISFTFVLHPTTSLSLTKN